MKTPPIPNVILAISITKNHLKCNIQAEIGKLLGGTGIQGQHPGRYISSQIMNKSDKEVSHEL